MLARFVIHPCQKDRGHGEVEENENEEKRGERGAAATAAAASFAGFFSPARFDLRVVVVVGGLGFCLPADSAELGIGLLLCTFAGKAADVFVVVIGAALFRTLVEIDVRHEIASFHVSMILHGLPFIINRIFRLFDFSLTFLYNTRVTWSSGRWCLRAREESPSPAEQDNG